MKVLHLGVCGVALVSLVGCSAMGLGSKPIDYKAGAGQVQSLEVPPGLTAPVTDDTYKVDGAEGESVATYSAYNKEKSSSHASSMPESKSAAAVLPAVKGVSLERDGAQRYLKVDEPAEKVWPVVKSFVNEAGFKIQSEDQAAGIIETDWPEKRARDDKDSGILTRIFNGLFSTGERDRYRIRLERSKDGASTSVYVTHYGKEEVLDSTGTTTNWQSRPNDPEMEAEMLQRLMVRFGVNPAQAAVATTQGGAAASGAANLGQIFDGSSIIVINDAFDKSWRRVGLAIEKTGLVVEDKDREKGIYYVHTPVAKSGWLQKLEFWKDEDTAQHFRVNVKDNGASCDVSMADMNGESSNEARQQLEAIYKNINQ